MLSASSFITNYTNKPSRSEKAVASTQGGESTKKRSKEAEELLGMLEEIRTADTDDGLEQFIATLLIRICVLSSSRFGILIFYMSAILAVLLSILHRLP